MFACLQISSCEYKHCAVHESTLRTNTPHNYDLFEFSSIREQMFSGVSRLVFTLLALSSLLYCLSMSALSSPAAARNKEPIWKVSFDRSYCRISTKVNNINIFLATIYE